jgi:hypothetical protein
VKTAALVPAFLADGQLHVVRYLKISALEYCGAYCGTSGQEGGIYHVPNWAFDGRTSHGDVEVCMKCSAAMCALAEPR